MRLALETVLFAVITSCAIAAGKTPHKLLQLYMGGDLMQDTIEKLYRGELYPAEQINPMLQDFQSKWHKSKDNVTAFSNQLSDELKPLFEAVMVDKLELATLEQTQAFVDGFKLGAKMLVEVLITTPISEKE